MACTSFVDCITAPISGTGAAGIFTDLKGTSFFFVNLTTTLIFSMLVVFVVFNIVKAIWEVSQSPSEELMKKFQAGMTNAIYAAVGLILIMSARVFISILFNLIGIPDSQNPFI